MGGQRAECWQLLAERGGLLAGGLMAKLHDSLVSLHGLERGVGGRKSNPRLAALRV